MSDDVSKLSPATQATLEQLEGAEWFTQVGQPIEGDDVRVVDSWEEAIRLATSPEWIERKLAVMNDLRISLMQADPKHIDHYEDVLEEIELSAIDVAHWHCQPLIDEGVDENLLEAAIQDMRGVLIEAEFANVVPPGFHAGLSYWYANGRFPCGYQNSASKPHVLIY